MRCLCGYCQISKDKDKFVEQASSAKEWSVYPELSREDFHTYTQSGIEPLLAQLLHNRGITEPAAMHRFLNARYEETPDPFTLIDMPRAIERIQRALAQGEHITVYGDYDADGVTSSALLFRALRILKDPQAILDFYIPSRLHEGCGLNLNALDQLKARGTSLIITTDCASSDVAQVDYAKSLGIDVIITDHHQPPEPRPDVYAMINPWRPDCTYSERYLCGVGIAFKLVQALYRKYNRPVTDEQDLLDLVAVGTVADVAALLGENHTLVRLGLQKLNQTQKPGLLALMRKANLQLGSIRERDIAYGLAPRINAAGRMQDASLAFQLLTTDDHEQASGYADELENLNYSRQRQTEELMDSVREQAHLRPNDAVVLVSGDNWHEGIIGLVAGKLSEELNRTVIVLSRGVAFSRGSARGPQGMNIILALRDRADLLEKYGGHNQAAGFTIANERVEELRTHLLGWKEQDISTLVEVVTENGIADATGLVTEQESVLPPSSMHKVDLVLTRLERLNYTMYNKIRMLSPFGAANPEPIFKLHGARILSRWSSGVDGRHLRLLLSAGGFQWKGTLLRGGHRLPNLPVNQIVNVIFCIEPARLAMGEVSQQDIVLRILHLEKQTEE
jgi:single-stranded-DNA-specific exonuclease